MTTRFTKIMSAALAATLLTASAASAAPRDRFSRPAPRAQVRNNNNAALGFGLFALGALAIIAASQSSKNTARYDDRYYAPPPPPSQYYNNGYYGQPSYGQPGYGPSTDYDGRYNGYNNGYDTYNHNYGR